MKLIDKINHLRLHASFLFDLGKSQGMEPREIAKTIMPLSGQLDKSIKEASLKEKAMAVKSLEHQIEAHFLDRQLVEQKIEECKDYIDRIKATFTENLHEEGYSVTIVESEVNIR